MNLSKSLKSNFKKKIYLFKSAYYKYCIIFKIYSSSSVIIIWIGSQPVLQNLNKTKKLLGNYFRTEYWVDHVFSLTTHFLRFLDHSWTRKNRLPQCRSKTFFTLSAYYFLHYQRMLRIHSTWISADVIGVTLKKIEPYMGISCTKKRTTLKNLVISAGCIRV